MPCSQRGGGTSQEWAPRFADAGIVVIDNSSAWRMDPEKKLIVPEINGHVLTKEDRIIANPNCSTIQMVMAIAPIHREYGIRRIVVSTYQSVTGTGIKAIHQLEAEEQMSSGAVERLYPHPIHRNVLPHCDQFQENGYTKEEMKLVNETRKILDDDTLRITATAVRVPVVGGHAESVNLELAKPFALPVICDLLSETPGYNCIGQSGTK